MCVGSTLMGSPGAALANRWKAHGGGRAPLGARGGRVHACTPHFLGVFGKWSSMEETGDCPFRREINEKAKGAPAATGRRSTGPRTLGRSGAPASSTALPSLTHLKSAGQTFTWRRSGGPDGDDDPRAAAGAPRPGAGRPGVHAHPQGPRTLPGAPAPARPPPPAPAPRRDAAGWGGLPACRGQAPSPEPTPGGAVGGWGGAGPRRPRWVPRGPAPARPGPARPAREREGSCKGKVVPPPPPGRWRRRAAP